MKDDIPLINKIINLFQQESTKIAILMSGSGSNAVEILNQQCRYNNLKFSCIITDQQSSNAKIISEKFKLKYYCIPGKNLASKEEREKYFSNISECLDKDNIELLIYAGFMKIATPSFVKKFPGINIHPADLSICNQQGMPKYVGMNAIESCLENKEKYLASTVHVVDTEVDCGQPIAISKHLEITDELRNLPIKEIHKRLKQYCEYVTYPEVLYRLSKERISIDQLPMYIYKC